jgi:hypothetical protein
VAGCRLSECVNQVDRRRSLLHTPIRMRRPACAREALCRSPLVQAGWADASRVERVPLIAAGAEPLVLFPGRPAAERAADARRCRLTGLLIISSSSSRSGAMTGLPAMGEIPSYYDLVRITHDRGHLRE